MEALAMERPTPMAEIASFNCADLLIGLPRLVC